jgi:hypothetical protein
MTSITNTQASLLAMQVTGTQKTSQANVVPNNDVIADIFGSAVSYNLSGSALDMLGLGSSDSTDAIDDLLTNYSSYLGNSSKSNAKKDGNNGLDAIFAVFGTGNVSATSSISAIMDIGFSENDYLYGNGPLPQFLKMIKTQMGLSAEQSTALNDIALQFRNADDTPETVAAVNAALQEAGIV